MSETRGGMSFERETAKLPSGELPYWVAGDGPPALDAASRADGPLADPAELLHELPKVLLGTRVTAGGDELEVVYLRRSVELQKVNGALRLGEDELGRPLPVPMDLALFASNEVL